MVRQRYAEAARGINAALKDNPDDMDALYTVVALEQTRVLDYESYGKDGARFISLADSVLKVLDGRQAALRGGDSLRCLFYRASVVGGAGLVLAKRGAWLEGAKNAMASLGMYRQLKKADPGHLGADLGLGVYDYYFGTTLKWIPFVSGGSVERGLAAAERALRAPFPFDHAAKSSYCWMLIDRGQYKKADSLASSVLRGIPGNTIFLRIRALIALWSGSYGDALLLGGKLKELSEARAPVNWSDLITSYYIITSAYENSGQRAEAEKAAEKGLSLRMPAECGNMPNVREHIKYLNGVKGKGGKKIK
jgi:tetratricopeptide (TPR) repeat protein